MNVNSTETRSVIVEREIPHPPEKVWRALTEPILLEEWLRRPWYHRVLERLAKVLVEQY